MSQVDERLRVEVFGDVRDFASDQVFICLSYQHCFNESHGLLQVGFFVDLQLRGDAMQVLQVIEVLEVVRENRVGIDGEQDESKSVFKGEQGGRVDLRIEDEVTVDVLRATVEQLRDVGVYLVSEDGHVVADVADLSLKPVVDEQANAAHYLFLVLDKEHLPSRHQA